MSNHGGARRGSGRKKTSLATLAKPEGIMPIDFLMRIVRDERDKGVKAYSIAVRMEAAKAAAPYLHPRLSAIEVTADGEIEHIHEIKVVYVAANNPDV